MRPEAPQSTLKLAENSAGPPVDLGFPIWVRATYWFNVLFMTLLIRSGIAILAEYPMLYWNQDCRPGSQWLKLSRGACTSWRW